MTLLLGHLNFLNAYPLYGGLEMGFVTTSAKLISGTPTQLNALLAKGELDLSLISAYEYLCRRNLYEPVSHLCIAAKGPVKSVTLYVRGSVANLDGERLALTQHSASAAQLVKLLCAFKWKVSPRYERLPDLQSALSYPGFLLIGDQALSHPHFPGFQSVDLAAEWFEFTHLPMTFALFAARRDVMHRRCDEIITVATALQASLRWSEQQRDLIVQLAAERSCLPRETLTEYYGLLTYQLGSAEQEGLLRFEELSERLVQTAEVIA